MKPYRVVFVTASNSKEAKKIAQSLLKNKLAACINILPSIQSSYWWKNKIETASETMLIIKTTQKKWNNSLHTFKKYTLTLYLKSSPYPSFKEIKTILNGWTNLYEYNRITP